MNTGKIALKDEEGRELTSVTVNLDKNRRFTGSDIYQGVARFFDLSSNEFTLSDYNEVGSYINDSTLYKYKSGMSVQAFDEPISKMIKTIVVDNEYGPELRYKVYPDLSDWSEIARKIGESIDGKVIYVIDGFGKNHPADSRSRISSREANSGRFSFIADVEKDSSDDSDDSDEYGELRRENDLLRSELEKVRLELEEARKGLAIMRRREPSWDSSDSDESPALKRRFPVKPPSRKPFYSDDSDSDEELMPSRPLTVMR